VLGLALVGLAVWLGTLWFLNWQANNLNRALAARKAARPTSAVLLDQALQNAITDRPAGSPPPEVPPPPEWWR
jgi:hypothetical protein